MRRHRVAIAAALISVSAISPSLSQDISSIKTTLAAKQCPPAEISPIDVYQRCGGASAEQACDRQYPLASTAWQQCYAKLKECADQVSEDNQVIFESNRVYRLCHANDDHGHSYQASKPSGAALAKQVEDARQKAEEAKTKAREAADKAEQTKKNAEEEKSRLKAEAVTLPSWCQATVNSCEQRATSLSNASSETQSQCKAYCRTLQIEDCNGASSTIQQAAQACNAGAQNDQRQAMQDDKRRREEERRRREKEEEEANRIPAGWVRCPCPADDMYLLNSGRAKLINGVLYHPRDVGPCGGG
jgi:hypothetical protein